MLNIGKIYGAPTVTQDLSKYGITAGGSTGGTINVGGAAKIVNAMAEAYAIPAADQVRGYIVYDKATQRNYLLDVLPASTAANWIVQGAGDTEDSIINAVGNFNPLTATRKCNTDQTILAATLPPMKKYKIIATADLNLIFDLPLIGESPMKSGTTWGLRAGDALTFYKTADGTAIDCEG